MLHVLLLELLPWIIFQVNKIFAKNAFDAVMHFAAVAYVGESTVEPLRYIFFMQIIYLNVLYYTLNIILSENRKKNKLSHCQKIKNKNPGTEPPQNFQKENYITFFV